MRRILLSAVVLASIAVGALAAPKPSLDQLAERYVELIAQAERVDPDSFSVGSELARAKAEATARPLQRGEIVSQLGSLVSALDRLQMASDPRLARRQRYLRAHAVSAALQLQPELMAALPITERIRQLYGFEPVFPELASFDASIDALDEALPGKGSLPERIAAMSKRAEVPAGKIEAVVRTAVAECRRRTAAHMRLPKEQLEIAFPADPLIPGQSQYLGDGKGVMSVSTVVPANVDRLLQMACHEAYPGHHTNYAAMDEQLWRTRHWVEMKASLRLEPQFAVSDAISEYGVGMVFPLDERLKFEREVLYPLAGITPQDEAAWRSYISARSSVLGATSTVIRDYLDRKIDANRAKALITRYRLSSPRSAEQLIKMVDALGPDIIASDQGWLAIDRAFARKPLVAKWRLLTLMEEEPMLLGDVRAMTAAP